MGGVPLRGDCRVPVIVFDLAKIHSHSFKNAVHTVGQERVARPFKSLQSGDCYA